MAKKKKKQIDGHCIGLSRDGKVKECAVEVQGRTVRLTDYQGFNHIVHPSKVGSTDGWCQEYAQVRDVADVKYFPQMMSGGKAEKEHIEALKEKAAKMAKAVAAGDPSDN